MVFFLLHEVDHFSLANADIKITIEKINDAVRIYLSL